MASSDTPLRPASFAIWAAVTILVSAFLLFQVQPVISKMILPWFGGSSAVWSTCMLFFQLVLLAGYGYAHALTSLFSPRRQVAIHIGVVALAILTLPITPSDYWRPIDGTHASLRILLVLARHVGLPYFVLSTTGPLVQAWFGGIYPGRSPYRLYALSNIGSLTALLSYPFIFEPRLTLGQQDLGWSWGFGLFGLLNAALFWGIWRYAPDLSLEASDEVKPEPQPKLEQRTMWLLLPALASIALLAVTNHLSQDVAAVPFLWVMPLSLYLLSFILCFDSDRWYVRILFAPAAMASILWLCLVESAESLDRHFKTAKWAFGSDEQAINYPVTYLLDTTVNWLVGGANWLLAKVSRFQIAPFDASDFDYDPFFQGLFYLTSLFLGCMVCHGELARLKPAQRHLTEYYLLIAGGGALGGIFVALLCPVLFVWYAELPLAQAGIFLVASVALGLMVFGKISSHHPGSKWLRFGICATALAGVGVLSADSSLQNLSPNIRGWACLVMAFVAAGLAYGIVATSNRELQVICSAIAGLLMLSGLFGLVLGNVVKLKEPNLVAAKRSFYGALQVKNTTESQRGHPGRWLTHGRIQHGFQHLGEEVPGFAREGRPLEDLPPRYQPATYYVQGSGVGLAIERHPNYVAKKPFKIGVVGLGTGTIAAYGRPGDEIRFYEIDETVKELSYEWFTYRQDSLAKATEVVLGDARVQMEREEPQNYDVLAIDAFSGDAIPVHLLTRECLAVYQKHLKPDGILAVHISNRYLDLAPVVRALAQRGEMRVESFHYLEGQRPSKVQDTASEWMLVTKNSDFFNDEVVADAITPQLNARVIEWTDQYSNLSDILQW